MNFSEAVRLIRESRGYSQGELARRAGLAKATVNDLETNAGRSPGLDTLAKIAVALEVHVGTLPGITPGEAGSRVEETDQEGAAADLAALGLHLQPEEQAGTRFFRVERGFSLHAIRFHAGDVLTVTATGEPNTPGPVVIERTARQIGFEVKLYLDPYLIGPDTESVLQHEMKQSPEIKIIGGIRARAGRLA